MLGSSLLTVDMVSRATGERCDSFSGCELIVSCSLSGLLISGGSLMLGSSVLGGGEVKLVPSKSELSEDVKDAAILTVGVAGVLEDSSTNAHVCWTVSGGGH